MNRLKSTLKLNNSGFSLIELIVVIAILGVMAAGMSIGISLAFSKDAAQCATNLNNAIYEVRMDTMSKPGTYTLTIQKNGNDFEAVINDGSGNETIPISEKGKIEYIKVKFDSANYDIATGPFKIKFDKAKGHVSEVNDTEIASSSHGIIEFDVKQKNGDNKHEYVSLITATGKHTVGKYN